MTALDTNELVLTIVDQAHTIRRQTEEIERLTRERDAAVSWQRQLAQQEPTKEDPGDDG